MESKAIVGKPVPDFTLENENGESVTLSSFRGKCVVLYFYPKDNTPGCTLEAQDFRDHLKDFEALNTIVLGVSKDSVKSHMNFAKKLNLNFHLLSDPEAKVHKIFDVLKPKKRFGKEYVMSVLPHRDPFLLVDGVIEEQESKIVAFRDIREDDPVFKGHFPDYPIYPGVLIIEGLAQAAGVLLMKEAQGTPLFIGIEKARFKREVKPGDRLVYEVELVRERMGIVTVEGKAKVEEKVVTVATILVGMKRS